MKYYRSYMDRQEISPERHEQLMDLNVGRKAPSRPWTRYAALAACAALVLGAGLWKGLGIGKMPTASNVSNPELVSDARQPGEADAAPQCDNLQGFVVSVPEDAGKLAFPALPDIQYQDRSSIPEAEASRAIAPGSFTVDLTKEDIQAIFWGPAGKPEAEHPKLEQGDLPWALFWEGYTLRGYAWYDGEGQFTELTIYGAKDKASFTLELRLGALPFSCVVYGGTASSEMMGTPVNGWFRAYDRDGDGQTDYICGSEFMADNNIGVRFENINASMQSEYGGAGGMELGGAETFNALFVRQVLAGDGGLYLDHLMRRDSVPAWRKATFDTLEQARQEADFAPYLPTAEPEGYSAYTGNKDFFARLSYQEGRQNQLFVRWSREYDDVEVCVQLPEGENFPYQPYPTVDISVPESYDTRLYDIPWWDTVPEEYRAGFYDVTFRAEDMSLEAVEARQIPRDMGGEGFHFNVLHPNGVVVSYYCNGVTAQEVWEMVESTLS